MKLVAGISEEAAHFLAREISQGDFVECGAVGLTPYASLVLGSLSGPSFTIMGTDNLPYAAGGWTRTTRSIWSHFKDMKEPESKRELMRLAVPAIRGAVIAAGPGMPLHNMVWDGNREALAWLRATHCFNFLDSRIRVGNSVFLPFEAKPLEDLPNV